jgi:hypothetical protein
VAVTERDGRLLSGLQDELESIYGVEAPARVEAFLIDRDRWTELSGDGAPEELVLRQDGDDLEMGLYLEPAVLDTLARPGAWDHAHLGAHCQAVEGVSHFVYLTHRAAMPRPVSQLELELQAEVDKYVTVLLRLWRAGRREGSAALRRMLFERVSYRHNLSAEARDTYEKANVLARTYCRFLEARYVLRGSMEGLLADLRRLYRLGAGEKLSHAAQGTAL